MKNDFRNSAFSIAEILIALGILTVALVFIAGVFPVGIHFTQENIDKTTAAIVANEAFAKMKLYAAQAPDYADGFHYQGHRDFNDWFMDTTFDTNDSNLPDYYIDANAFVYPSEPSIYVGKKKYCWSAICRKVPIDPNFPDIDKQSNIQVTVFVCNRGNHNLKYYKARTGRIDDFLNHDYYTYFDNPPEDYGQIVVNTTLRSTFPQPVRIEVLAVPDVENEIEIVERASVPDEKFLVNDGDLLVDDYTGEIFRVLERYPGTDDDIVLLDKKWQEHDDLILNNHFYMWVVPPAAAPGAGGSDDIRLSGKSPLVGIYQKVIRF